RLAARQRAGEIFGANRRRTGGRKPELVAQGAHEPSAGGSGICHLLGAHGSRADDRARQRKQPQPMAQERRAPGALRAFTSARRQEPSPRRASPWGAPPARRAPRPSDAAASSSPRSSG